MNGEDLWGELLPTEIKSTPGAILTNQAVLLGKKTEDKLKGLVARSKNRSGGITLSFSIVAPLLEDYSYEILRVYHNIKLYPLTLENLVKEYIHEVDEDTYVNEGPESITCLKEEDFIEKLSIVLRSREVKQVIDSLLAQVDEVMLEF
jgi:hypothetical protein